MKLLGIPTLNFYEFNCSDELVHRYTIAFNCFFEGVVSDRQTVDLQIKVKTVRDTI